MVRDEDISFMRRAFALAGMAAYSARPNPHVGCVLVRDDAVIGEGYTCPLGGNHAEIEALESSGGAQGATAYVTLEPCSHTGLTGPCADALIKAGISEIFVALEDPNPLVSGKGLELMTAAGLQVNTGLLSEEAEVLVAGYIARMRRGRGRVRVKLAMSLDGRTAMPSGESKWITNEIARQDVQLLRAQSCAIMTGIGTVMADDCELTTRFTDSRVFSQEKEMKLSSTLRVLLDSNIRVPKGARILSKDAPTLVIHNQGQNHDTQLPEHVEHQSIKSNKRGLDLDEVMNILNKKCCNEILVESGSRLAGSLLCAGLVDELIIYVAPTFLGSGGAPLLDLSITKMSDRYPLEIIDQVDLDGNFRLTVIPQAKMED